MTFAQAVATSSEVGVNTIIDAFAGIVALFILRAVLDSRDKVRSIWTALYGEHDARTPNGLVRKVTSMATKLDEHGAAFEAHVRSDEQWRTEARDLANKRNGELQVRLGQIDDKLLERRRNPRQRPQA